MMRFFATPQDAESAFYEALEQADIESMMRVWAEDEDVVCAHPQGQRCVGFAAVREGWRIVFAHGMRASVRVSDVVRRQGVMLATHSIVEHYSLPGEAVPRPPVIATHVYIHGAQGWHLLSRHASSAPPTPLDASVLH